MSIFVALAIDPACGKGQHADSWNRIISERGMALTVYPRAQLRRNSHFVRADGKLGSPTVLLANLVLTTSQAWSNTFQKSLSDMRAP